MVPTFLLAQDELPENTLKFEAIVDEATGEVKVVPKAELDIRDS